MSGHKIRLAAATAAVASGGTMLIIAKGFPNQFRTTDQEMAASDRGKWFPSVDDFRATAASSGGSGGEAATFAQLLEVVGNQEKDTIQDLGLIGHANASAFALSGRIMQDDLYFTAEGMIAEQSIKDNLKKIQAVRNRFKKDASLTLFACDAGSGKKLLDALSDAFEIQVQGFATEIFWCFTPLGPHKARRGKTYWDAQGLGVHPDCGSNQFASDIRTWHPNMRSNTGVHS